MRQLLPAALVVLAVGCGSKPKDVRVIVPPVEAGWYQVEMPEQVIAAGEDRMICTDVVYRGESTAFREVDAKQGKYGHHMILLSTLKPKPEGTTYDCSSLESMKDFRPFAIPLDLPAGHAMYLPQGLAMVAQMHYVNTGTEDILVRDYLRLQKVPESSVTRWAAPIATNKGDFMLPPNAAGAKTSFDCSFDKDVDLLLLGGHMHERGSTFKVELGPDVAHLTTRYEVKEWKADYRDAPPVELFTTNPLKITKGTVIRTSCSWNNDANHAVTFPEEMCSTFGVIAGTRDSWLCNLGIEL